jgi:hypothetical protein
MDVTPTGLTGPGACRDPGACGLLNIGPIPTTDRCTDTVASLLVTIHRDESGVFSTSVEALPCARRMAHSADLAPYAAEWVAESKTFATAAPVRTQAGRRRSLIAAVALVVAVLVVGAAAWHAPSGSSDSLSSPGSTVATPSSNALAPSTTGCPDASGSVCSDATTILPGLGTACTDLLTTAAHAIGEDPQQWTQTVLVSMRRSGKPLADVVSQWLTGTRGDVIATRYADVHLETILQDIDSALAKADTSACSPHA